MRKLKTAKRSTKGPNLLKRGTRVTVQIEGKIKNACCPDFNGVPTGYRITDGKRPAYWFVVPFYAVTVKQ